MNKTRLPVAALLTLFVIIIAGSDTSETSSEFDRLNHESSNRYLESPTFTAEAANADSSDTSESSEESLSTGGNIGVIVGCTVVGMLLFLALWKRKREKQRERRAEIAQLATRTNFETNPESSGPTMRDTSGEAQVAKESHTREPPEDSFPKKPRPTRRRPNEGIGPALNPWLGLRGTSRTEIV